MAVEIVKDDTFPVWTRVLPSFALITIIEDFLVTDLHWTAYTQMLMLLIISFFLLISFTLLRLR